MKQLATQHCVYAIIGKEVCPTTQTPHLQGYLHFANPRAFNAVKKLINNQRVHLENAKKGAPANRAYCSKTDKDAWEHGDVPNQGHRSDYVACRDLLMTGASWAEVDEVFPEITAKSAHWVEKHIQERALLGIQPAPFVMKWWQWQAHERMWDSKKSCFRVPQERDIIWIWSEESSTGKTEFLKHLAQRWQGAVLHASSWETAGIINLFDPTRHKVIHLNLPREVGQINWKKILEELSDRGLKSTAKYHGAIKSFQNAHIVVTANFEPSSQDLPDRLIKIWAQVMTAQWQEHPHTGEMTWVGTLQRDVVPRAAPEDDPRLDYVPYNDPSEEVETFLEKCQRELMEAFLAKQAAQAPIVPDAQEEPQLAIPTPTPVEIIVTDDDDIIQIENPDESFDIQYSEIEDDDDDELTPHDLAFINDEPETSSDESEADMFVPKRTKKTTRIEDDD